MKPIRSKALRNAARGEPCTLNVAGVCNYDPATVVLAHMPSESHGMAQKSTDINACFCCSSCHDWLDNRGHQCVEKAHREFYMQRALIRTLTRLFELGVITIKGAAA